MLNKKGNVLVTICVSLLVGVIGFGIAYYMFGNTGDVTIAENLNEIDRDIEQIEREVNNIPNEVETVEVGVCVPFDNDKLTDNKEKDIKYKVYIKYGSVYGIGAYIEDGKVYFNLNSNDAEYQYVETLVSYENEEIKIDTDKNYEITAFDKKVVDIVVSPYGQDLSYPVMLFLMEDGTVKSLNVRKVIIDGNFDDLTTLDYLENVVRLESCGVGVYEYDSDTEEYVFAGGGNGMLAIMSDGTSTLIDASELND